MNSLPQNGLKERLLAKVRYEENGCWFFTGKKNPAGYGKIKIERHEHYAHRVAYQVLRGDIPSGLTIDHLCKNKSCVNPDHMEPVPRGENTRRGQIGLDHSNRKPPVRTAPLPQFCKRGHEFTEANTRIYPHGGYAHRICRECVKLRMRGVRDQTRGIWREREKKCQHCGAAFLPTAGRQIFCGERCTANGGYARRRAALRKANEDE